MAKKNSPSKLMFTDGFAVDFRVPIPEFFADSLRKEELSKGDIFYSSKHAYNCGTWEETLRETAWAIQIRESMTGGKIVFFERLRRNDDLTGFVSDGRFKLHWDDFLARLKSGEFMNIEPVGI